MKHIVAKMDLRAGVGEVVYLTGGLEWTPERKEALEFGTWSEADEARYAAGCGVALWVVEQEPGAVAPMFSRAAAGRCLAALEKRGLW